jgi:hypothetical protein
MFLLGRACLRAFSLDAGVDPGKERKCDDQLSLRMALKHLQELCGVQYPKAIEQNFD